jgi:hypothetical protein
MTIVLASVLSTIDVPVTAGDQPVTCRLTFANAL